MHLLRLALPRSTFRSRAHGRLRFVAECCGIVWPQAQECRLLEEFSSRLAVGICQLQQIPDLHPTQIALGYQSVRTKIAATEDQQVAHRNEFLRHNAVKVVKGPDERVYIVDHHH
jgi:hypothetical protein